MQAERDHVIHPFLPVWARALRDETGATFREVAAPHVRLEGSIFATPIDGREKVWTSLRASGSSAEMGQRLGDSVGPGVFYQGPQQPIAEPATSSEF